MTTVHPDPLATLAAHRDRLWAAMADLRRCPPAAQDLRGPELRARQAATVALRRAFVELQTVQQIGVWPLLRRHHDEARSVAEAVERKRTIEEALIKLDWRTGRDGSVNRYVAFVLDETARLLEVEEAQAGRLPALATPEELVRLSRRLIRTARRAPTRPHPELPARPLLARLLSPVVALTDRLRDLLASRVVPT